MGKFLHFLQHELQEAIYPTLYFLFAFHLLAYTRTLILEGYQVTVATAAFATIAALTVAKAVLIGNSLSFINLFSGKPLIYAVLWKTLNYGVLCLVFRFLEELIPLWSKYHGLAGATEHVIADVSWPHFWASQIWLSILLLLYNSITELDRRFGAGSMRESFLGK